MLRATVLLAAGLGLWCMSQGAEAAGRQLQASVPVATTPGSIYHDNSKDYMLLGCFNDGYLWATSPEEVWFRMPVMNGTRLGTVSAQHCASLARAQKLPVFGTHNSDMCRSSGHIAPVVTMGPANCSSSCSDPQASDTSCGAALGISVYVWKGKEGYVDLGCYSYGNDWYPSSVDLTGSSATKMSAAECYRLSSAYDFFGIFKGSRCIGFISLNSGKDKSWVPGTYVGDEGCSAPCTGAAGTRCGGESAVQLYARNKPLPQLAPVTVSPDAYIHLGCITSTVQYNTFQETSFNREALDQQLLQLSGGMDTTRCASAAKRAGVRFFGTQWGRQCVGGVSLVRAVQHTKTTRPAICDAPCATSDLPGRTCGSKPATPDPGVKGQGWSYISTSLYVLKSGKDHTNLGCYALRPDRPPLPQLLLDSPKMTLAACYKKAAAYKFFAVFNGTRCYASDDLAPSLRHCRGSKGCTTPCSSSSKQTCGGPAAFMVYVNHAPKVPPVALSVGPAADVAKPVVVPTKLPSDPQRHRLLEGKAALDPTGTNPCLASWTSTTQPCLGDTPNWSRVCECSNGKVINLCLSRCGLTGTLPPTWGSLPGLEALVHVELSANRLSGPLPASWGNWTTVQHLLLEKNLLSGPLPDAWNQMAALTVVYLNSNKLNGTLPASWGTGALANLDHLDVANNEHTGILPPSWGGLTGLYALYLQNNTRLSGTIPCSWSSMGSKGQSPLTQLGVGSTGLTGCFPSAGMLAASDWVREAPIWVIDVPGKMDVPGVKGVRGTASCTSEAGGGSACPT